MPWYKKRWLIVALHAAFWLALFSLPFLLEGPRDRRPENEKLLTAQFMVYYVLNNSLWVAFFYLNAYLLVPKFFSRKKISAFVSILLLCLAFLILAGWVNRVVWVPELRFVWRPHIFFSVLIFMFMFTSSTTYRLIQERAQAEQLSKEKETENLKTELSLLRSQVSPHFMFNVLNNMVALARKKSDLLEPSLIKLSSLMRYMLYEADEDRVPLEKEAEYLKSYIDLQQQRFGNQVRVNVELKPADRDYEIEPMLLIPFVENAFKHGTGMIEQAAIDIVMEAKDNLLRFSVSNRFNPASEEVRDKTSGIGLTNVKRRLNLLYGKKHELRIHKEGDQFSADLTIQLTS
jgi:sensor histidine kinase YesM